MNQQTKLTNDEINRIIDECLDQEYYCVSVRNEPIERKTKVTVLDAEMGAGKTSYAMQWINKEVSHRKFNNEDRKWLYVTPFLDEISRVIAECPKANFIQPSNKGKSKASDFEELLMHGVNIATTHITFSTLSEKGIEYIEREGYTLILDEVLEVLLGFNDISSKHYKLKKDDVPFLINKGIIESDELMRVNWLDNSFEDFRYSDVERIAKTKNLYMLNKTFLLWAFPYEAFKAFDEVLVLTYMLDGSMMKPYFVWNDIDYKLASVKQLPNGEYTLCEYHNNLEARPYYKKLITIYDGGQGGSANRYDGSALSTNKCNEMKREKGKERIKKLQGHIKYFLKDFSKAKSEDILWTCKKSLKDALKGKGYSGDENESKQEKEAETPAEKAKLKAKRTCFLPLNARSYNAFQIKHTLAYVANLYCNPMTKDFFYEQGRRLGKEIVIDEDRIALAMMLQWIWRSAIRVGEPISIYIPSTRMRNLLIDWLDGKM